MTDPTDVLRLRTTGQDQVLPDARTGGAGSVEPAAGEQVTALCESEECAPVPPNAQSLRILVIRSRPARERLLGHVDEDNRAELAAAPLTAVLAYLPGRYKRLSTKLPQNRATQSLIGGRPPRSGAAKLSALIQMGYFILGLRAAGLTAAPTTRFHNEGVDQEFFSETGYKSLVVLTVGKPGENAWFPRDLQFEPEHVITTA